MTRVGSCLFKRNFYTTYNRFFSSTDIRSKEHFYKLVIVGGGAGGCGTANKFAGRLGKGQVAVIEPSDTHYYQPLWTLVGGGIKDFKKTGRPTGSLLPSSASWIKDSVEQFDPENNSLTTASGDIVKYEYLVVALGLQLDYQKIKGLPQAFDTPGVGSNYSPLYVEKTSKAIQDFKGGNAIFTFPNSPVKCAGAPQKIMYIAEETFRKAGIKADIHYYSSLGVLFGVKKYADALWDVVNGRGINIHLRHNLIEIKPDTKEAIFENLDTKDLVTEKYDLIHITPPMSTPGVLSSNSSLANPAGFLTVDKQTLQHTKFPNIFGIGDCTDVPTAKTAAAVAAQLGVIRKNLSAAIKGTVLNGTYSGYTSCPLVTGKGSLILAEFDMQAPPQPLETFPFNQAKERWSMYQLKAHLMPTLYWHGLVKGWWEGPDPFRKIMGLGSR